MKIRTLLIIGLFVVAFTPLILSIGLNMPRVLKQFRAAEEDRQLLLIQWNSREIDMALKGYEDSLRAMGFLMDAVELVSNRPTDITVPVMKKRVKNIIVQWYQDKPEVLEIRFFDRQGVERFAVGRHNGEGLVTLSESKDSSYPPSLIALADLHSNGEVYNSGFADTEHMEAEQHSIMRLGVGLRYQGEVVGAASLSIDISPLLQDYSAYLVQFNKETQQYTPLLESVHSAAFVALPEGEYPVEPIMVRDRNGQPLALIPFLADGHLPESVLFAYPVKLGKTMVWVEKWRKQMVIFFCLVFLVVFLIAVKLSALIGRFSADFFTAFEALLHKQQPLNFSWTGSQEMVRLSQDLNSLSRQYIESLNSQEVMRQEAQKIEKELRQSQKMKALGLLAGGVAHDLNNILSGIVSYPQLLLLQLPEESELRTPILEIQRSGERAAAVVADMLTVARGVASKKESADLNKLAREYFESPECKALQKNHPDVSCQITLFSEALPVFCSPVHVKKTLMNLVTNAVESIQGEGGIVVTTRRGELGGRESNGTPGDSAVLQVRDNGPGIAENDLEHIFEPFYSKKKMGRSGTGLGLTVVWNTMTDHDGRVEVSSSKEGTCFDLFFPLYQGGEDVPLTIPVEKDVQGNGEHILVIDDEAQQRDIAERILTACGYQVESVASGEEAVQFLASHESDLLLLDMIMDPGINGYETYRQILEIRPQQKAIIVSGFSESQDVEETRKLGAMDFLKKPYSIETLSRAVKEALTREEKTWMI